MKEIINGKMYDTETAEYIDEYSNNLGPSDFRHVDEALYITKKGNFFLAGEGGPMTKYSRPCGNMTSGGDGIVPLTRLDALDWAELHCDAIIIEKYFGDIIEDA